MVSRSCLLLASTCFCLCLVCSTPPGGNRAGRETDAVGAAVSKVPDGWTVVEPLRVVAPAQLYEIINGGAALFLEYSFAGLYTSTFRSATGDTVTVEVYRHADALNAFGVFARENDDCPAPSPAIAQSCLGPHSLSFQRGALYAKLLIRSGSIEACSKLALALAARLPIGDSAFAQFAPFPAQGLVAGSFRYFTRNYLGVKAMGPVFAADYRTGEAKATVFYVPAGTRPRADSLLAALKGVYDGESVKTFEAGSRLVVDDSFEGHIEVLVSGSTLAGCASQSAAPLVRATVDSLLSRLP